MKQTEIISKVKSLNLKPGQYAVFGSGLLGYYGLRESSDIDIVVAAETYAEIKARPGWKEILKPDGNYALINDVFEIMPTYNVGEYRPKIADLIDMAIQVEGVSFIPFSEVLVWKNLSRRPKDIVDIELMEKFLKSENAPKA